MPENNPETVIFEGPPVVGKTTQIEITRDFIENETGDTVARIGKMEDRSNFRELIDSLKDEEDMYLDLDPLAETYLWAAYYSEKPEIVRENQDKDYVLVDRYITSTMAVQERRLDRNMEEIIEMFSPLLEAIDYDKILFYTAEEVDFRERYRSRAGEKIPENRLEIVKEIQDNYLQMKDHLENVEYVDTSGQSVEEVQKATRDVIGL